MTSISVLRKKEIQMGKEMTLTELLDEFDDNYLSGHYEAVSSDECIEFLKNNIKKYADKAYKEGYQDGINAFKQSRRSLK